MDKLQGTVSKLTDITVSVCLSVFSLGVRNGRMLKIPMTLINHNECIYDYLQDSPLLEQHNLGNARLLLPPPRPAAALLLRDDPPPPPQSGEVPVGLVLLTGSALCCLTVEGGVDGALEVVVEDELLHLRDEHGQRLAHHRQVHRRKVAAKRNIVRNLSFPTG